MSPSGLIDSQKSVYHHLHMLQMWKTAGARNSCMLPAIPNPELIFGLCSPIGVDNKKVYSILSESLRRYSYKSEYFKVTDLMKSIILPDVSVTETLLEDRYDSYIKYANRLREIFKLDYALSMLCCLAIRSFRRSIQGDPRRYIPAQAYIFDQFKRREEILLLRQVYGRLFILVSIYSERENRLESLVNRIASDHAEARLAESHRSIASNLIKRDRLEEGVPHGQRLEETFPEADLFINIDDPECAEKLVARFLDALFGSNSVSPTRDEYGMYSARNAALRSLDLSRQVGAAIFSPSSEIISLGCNEVPKAHGGTYWTGDSRDSRDFKKGFDSNERIKKSLLVDFTKRLKEAGFLGDEGKSLDVVQFIIKETSKGGALRDAQLMDLLEFGRMIHAEMSAICDAARLGRAIQGATLYCTTFPCHLCAKHIVASGIKRVVYIEPYPKSYAEQLHGDAIEVERRQSHDKVTFEPFIGVSPFRYRELFFRGKRKNGVGDFELWNEGQARLNIKYTVPTYIENEFAVAKIITNLGKEKILKNELVVAVPKAAF